MTKEIIIAIAGNPNSGKSTVFNAITGAIQHIGNYPGVTVEKKSGTKNVNGEKYTFVDLPGSYTLSPFSEDERVATEFIIESKPDAIINIVDATSLQRGLFLTLQLIETNIPVVVGLNMFDIVKKNGDTIDIEKLSLEIQAPVIPLIASKRDGINELLELTLKKAHENKTERNSTEKFKKIEEDTVSSERYAKIDKIIEKIYKEGDKKADIVSNRIDSVLTHKILGPLIMFSLLFIMFQIVFSLGEYPAGWLESLFGAINDFVDTNMNDGYLKSLIMSGIIDGVGGVMGFVPLIFIMFLFISIFEDSGYMARIAFMLDRVMRMFGLHGNSVMALVISGGIAGGCAVPGVMATRTLKDKNERLATILATPFMNCGAKLPVYALLIAAFFSSNEGGVMLLLTIISWAFALLGSLLLRKTILKGESAAFIMDLPQYHIPSARNVLQHSWEKTWMYIKKAGTVILAISILMWVFMTFPEMSEEQETVLRKSYQAQEMSEDDIENNVASEKLANSFAGKLGTVFETVSKPLTGFDWRTDIALLGGFAAKEVIVSTLGTAYSMGDTDPEESEGLSEKIAGEQGWSPSMAFALLLFVMLYAPCFVTVTVIKKETGSWKWALFSIAYSTTLAAFVATLTFHIGNLFI